MRKVILFLVLTFMMSGCVGHRFEITYTSDKGTVTERTWCMDRCDSETWVAPFFVKNYEDSISVLYKMNPTSNYFVPVYSSQSAITIESVYCLSGKKRIPCSWWFD